jgi:choline monooxygenase
MSTSLSEMLRLFNPDLPLERAHTIPALWYHDPEIFAQERQQVFGNTWQAVGRLDQVMERGSYFTFDLAGEPILVVRDNEGLLRAFYNVCRHRAAQVMNEPQGKATKFRCRYHGWTYDLTGRLRGTPEFDGVADFCKEEEGLRPLSVATWGPLVFVHPEPRQSLLSFLAPLPEKTANMKLDQMRFVERRDYTLNCNWKVYVDNYQDGGYHVNTVHPALAGALDYAHYRTEISGNTSVQISPLKPPDNPELAKVRSGDNAYYWWIFPNLMVNLYQGVMDTNLVLPLGPERCRVIFDFYFADTQGDEAKRFIAQSVAVAEQIQQEDIGICEEVQRGLNSRSFDTGRFSVKRESGGYYFHRLLALQLLHQE